MKTLLFLLVIGGLFSACKSQFYIGQTEKEYNAKNDGKIVHSDLAKDSNVYETKVPLKGVGEGRYKCTYCTFKNGTCIKITTGAEIIEYRQL